MHATLDQHHRPSQPTRGMTPSSARLQPAWLQPSSVTAPLFSLLLISAILPAVLPQAIPDECFLPLHTGNGGFPLLRYCYRPSSGECVSFQYWSSGGNDNNFETLKECEETCIHGTDSPTTQPTLTTTQPSLATTQPTVATTQPTTLDPDFTVTTETSPSPITTEALTEAPSEYPAEICHLPIKNGLCPFISLAIRYWYNRDTNNCELFSFFNCHGNENNFASYEECMDTCEVIASSSTPDPPPDPAPSFRSDTSSTSPSPTQTSKVSFVAMETVAPPAFSSAQPHPPQNTATVHPLSPTPLNHPTVNEPIDTTTHVGPGTPHGLPDFIFPVFPRPTEDSVSSEEPSPSGNSPSQSHSRTLSVFDLASIVIGAIALLLVVLLVTIVAVLLCRHRRTSVRLKTVQYSESRLRQNSCSSKSSYA